MKRKPFRSGRFFLLMVLVAALPLLVARYLENARRNAPKAPYKFPLPELAALDQVVQARFAVIPDKDFGIARVGVRHEYFSPATAQEKAVVQGLNNLKDDVYFYIAGTTVLAKDKNRTYPHRSYPPVVLGPIIMSPRVPLAAKHTVNVMRSSTSSVLFRSTASLPRDLPGEAVLRRLGVEALPVFETTEGITKNAGEWQISMVPVRVSDQACARCHSYYKDGWTIFDKGWRQPALGDTLGVAMYAYRRKEKS